MSASKRDRLNEKLEVLDREIAEHSFNSPEVLETNRVVEEFESAGTERVEEELKSRGLPSLAAHGLVTAKGAYSFGRLHRKRKAVMDRIAHLDSRM